MIRPPGWDGVAFSEGSDGDIRNDMPARSTMSRRLGLRAEWATVRQVHGNDVVCIDVPGDAGEADAIWTSEPDLPVAVFTADCFGVVLHADNAVGVAHAGWRGAEAGVIERLRHEMTEAGRPPRRAALGPGIGPCCFEVGAEVAQRFDGLTAATTWGATSVDLPAVVARQLEDLELWSSGACTFHDEGWFSHRVDGTKLRMAALGWRT